MNEFLRIARRAFNRLGYDLKKAGKFTLLPLQNQRDPHLKVAYDAFDQDKPPSQSVLASDLDKLIIYIRTCLRSNRNIDTTPRFTGVSTAETIYRCVRSTIRSINHAYHQEGGRQVEVVILDDHSDASYLLKIKELCQEIQCPWKIQTTQETGQGPTLREQFELAKPLDALCYFCEDDYLHEPSAIWEMWHFYRQMVDQTNSHMALHPQECEPLYLTHYPSYIITSEKRHWRTTSHATHVLFTHSHVVRLYWDYFENAKYVGNRKYRHLGSESKTTNLLFQHIPGFCPLPAVAGHTQFQISLPPCFNWEKIWKENAD